MLQQNQVNYRAFQYYARLKRVKEHVDQYYAEEMSLEKAARIAATEKTYFSNASYNQSQDKNPDAESHSGNVIQPDCA